MDDQLNELNGKTIGSLQRGLEIMLDEIKKIKSDQIEMIKATSKLTQALDSLSENIRDNKGEIKDHNDRLISLEKDSQHSSEESKTSKTNSLAWIAISIAAVPAVIQLLGLIKKLIEVGATP